MTVNAETGFLECVSPSSSSFDSCKKVKFLELAHEALDNKQWPHLSEIAKAVGVTRRTAEQHLHSDEKFNAGWSEIKLRINDVFTAELAQKAFTKNGVIANLAVLKYNESGSWIDQQKVNFSANFTVDKGFFESSKGYLEAELVAESPTEQAQIQVNTGTQTPTNEPGDLI